MKRGKIIVIEGTDGSGKKTQSEKLFERLNREGMFSEMMSFPRYFTPTGRIIGQCYLGKNLGEGDAAWFGNPDKVDFRVASMLYACDRLAAVPEILEIINLKVGDPVDVSFNTQKKVIVIKKII